MLGARSIWKGLKNYLEKSQMTHVSVYGKSLGGAHAQYITALILGKTSLQVDKLTTFASVGVPYSVQNIYNEIIPAKSEPRIIILRNAGNAEKSQVDYIPFVGGIHLHSQNNTRVYYVSPPQQLLHPDFIPRDIHLLEKFKRLMDSFSHGHARQTTLSDYECHLSERMDDDVNAGTQLEMFRRRSAQLLNIMTFGFLSGQSFREFYTQESL
jgi:hypothetical protein